MRNVTILRIDFSRFVIVEIVRLDIGIEPGNDVVYGFDEPKPDYVFPPFVTPLRTSPWKTWGRWGVDKGKMTGRRRGMALLYSLADTQRCNRL